MHNNSYVEVYIDNVQYIANLQNVVLPDMYYIFKTDDVKL